MLLRNRTRTLWFEHWNAHICFQYSFNELMLPLSLSGEDPLLEQRKAVTMHTALLHQKSYPTVRSTGNQEIPVALSAGKIGAGAGPWITSSCHYSSKVCEPSGKIFGEAMHKMRQDVAARLLTHKNIVPLLAQTLPGCRQAAYSRLAKRRCTTWSGRRDSNPRQPAWKAVCHKFAARLL